MVNQGIRPAVNVGISVSRVGGAAQTKAMKKVAGTLRLEMAQFKELQAFVQFASDLDENTKKQIRRGQLMVEILKQTDGEPLPFEKEVVVIYAAINGYFDDVELSSIRATEAKLHDYMAKLHRPILETIATTNTLDDATEAKLKSALEAFKRDLKS